MLHDWSVLVPEAIGALQEREDVLATVQLLETELADKRSAAGRAAAAAAAAAGPGGGDRKLAAAQAAVAAVQASGGVACMLLGVLACMVRACWCRGGCTSARAAAMHAYACRTSWRRRAVCIS